MLFTDETAVDLTVMYPGVPEALTILAQSHRLGICTNKLHRPCIAVLKHLKINQFFQTVWGGDNPLARKPNPAPLQAAFEDLGTGLRIFIGDSEIDAETPLFGLPMQGSFWSCVLSLRSYRISLPWHELLVLPI